MLPERKEDPLYRRIRRHAERRNLAMPEAKLADYKEFLRLEGEMSERYHRQGQGGLRVAHSRSIFIDVLLESLFLKALRVSSLERLADQCAILALGGYGRAEMCPFSDVDIMFLYPRKIDRADLEALQKAMTDVILYTLWDCGLKVGHSSRNELEAIAQARENVETKNALLESRRVTGSTALWQSFHKAYSRYSSKENPLAYLEQRLEDQRKRHEQYGNTPFLQEPDIKNGVGGMRDYQNTLWLARLKMDIASPEDLVPLGYLTKTEHREFTSAYEFLIRARTELHLQSRRPTDLLDLEKQPQVAWYLGYRYTSIFRRVEAFMRDYYRCAESIHRISSYLEHRLALTSRTSVSFRDAIEARKGGRGTRETDGFVIYRGILRPRNERVFEEDPERLIRVFRHAQQSGAQIDIELQSLINTSRHLIDSRVINSPTANRAFLAILQEGGNVYPTLSLMNACGILRRFVPEFRGLHCLVQHEYYHRYTADIHTLNTIQELDQVFSSNDDPNLAEYRRVLRDTSSPALPYLALLLHDVGKADGIQGHAERGATMAREALARMKVNPEQSDKILVIIERHLDMARFWQRYDIEDPQTARLLAELIPDEETLRYLYVVTYCDARGTATGLWNSYKNMLHTQLFKATLAALAGQRTFYSPEDMIPKDTIREKLPELSEEEIEAHYNLLPERYFIYNNADEIALHLRMVNELLRHISEAESLNSLVPIVHWSNDLNLSMTVVNIVTWDRAGLFYKLAGAFSVAGLSIVSSKAMTRADHITLDTFYVIDPNGGVVQNEKAREVVQKHLEKALLQNEDLMPAIMEKAKKRSRPSWASTTDRLRAPLPPSVGVYHELSLKRTIIEVQCSDRIGLLYRLAKAIYDHGFDISFARIATERNVAVDTFYIEQIDRRQVDSANLLALREALQLIVAEDSNQDSEPKETRRAL